MISERQKWQAVWSVIRSCLQNNTLDLQYLIPKKRFQVEAVFVTINWNRINMLRLLLPEVGVVYWILYVIQGVSQWFEFKWIQVTTFCQALQQERESQNESIRDNEFSNWVGGDVRKWFSVSPWSGAGERWDGKLAVWVQGSGRAVLRQAERWTASPCPGLPPRSVSAAHWADLQAACLDPGPAVQARVLQRTRSVCADIFRYWSVSSFYHQDEHEQNLHYIALLSAHSLTS